VKDDAPIVRAALDATRSNAPRVAVGFSQGAYLALDLVKARREAFRAMVLLGANVNPDAKLLAAAGVTRVVLAASKDEPWHASLEKNAARLAREGVAARFVNLGHVGHMYIADDPAVLREAIAWASAP
jgi:predicted esterase